MLRRPVRLGAGPPSVHLPLSVPREWGGRSAL